VMPRSTGDPGRYARDLVLVHGAWHGGWCWGRLRPILEDMGHRVWTPTLTGLGERAHLARRDTGLETHILDLVNLLEFEDIRRAVLVAHSYSGVPATVVADRCADRLLGVIYLDSSVPRDGQNAFDVFPGSEEPYRRNTGDSGEGWLIPPPEGETFGVTSGADLAWIRSRLTPHPLKTFQDPVRLGSGHSVVRAAAVICTNGVDQDVAPERGFADMAIVRIAAGHDVMISDPALAAETIDELAASMA
jgi:pimeloyl-ACP methyl ester carboxylesterase